MTELNVLSLFDWMSCWMLALEKAEIPVSKYYASEIDKFAIQVSKKNYPQIQHIWDVKDIWYHNGALWRWEDEEISEERENIDLLMWGSPCQWFSIAWKQLNFEDPRSKLFFEYVRLLKETKPKYFLLENVKMKKEYQDIISKHLWVEPIEINSALVSAQNRKRLYWFGVRQEDWTYKQIKIGQPKDREILLKDILQSEEEIEDNFYISDKVFEKLKKYESNARLSPLDWKSYCLNTMQWWHRQPKIALNVNPSWRWQNWNVYNTDNKSPTLTTNKWEWPKILQRPRWTNQGWIKANNWKTPCLSANSWEQNNLLIRNATKQGYIEAKPWDWVDISFPNSKTKRWRVKDWKAWTLVTSDIQGVVDYKLQIRKLTPLECERLQTVPDNYTDCVSNTQRYKMLWNGWTIDVIAYLLSHIKDERN